MRVAWLVQHLWPETVGGVALQVEAVSRHMHARGHRVTLWACAVDRGRRMVRPDGRGVIGIGGLDGPGRFWRLAPLWKARGLTQLGPSRRDADVVFSADPVLSMVYMLLRPGVPLICCPGGTVSGSFPWHFPVEHAKPWRSRVGTPAGQYLFAERFCLQRAPGIIAVSSRVRGQMLRVHRGSAGRIRVIHTGYEPDAMRARAHGPASDGLTVICVGRLHRIKNIGHLIRAWGLVRCASKHLMIVGDGEEGAGLRRLAGQVGVSDSVSFLGERLDVPDLLAGADVFVLPSRYEACPIAVIEAMGTGLPCITLASVPGVSEVGASGELNVDGETGFCVVPDDPGALAAKIDYLADHPEVRRRMGGAARRRAESRFTWGRASRAYLRFAEDLVAGVS